MMKSSRALARKILCGLLAAGVVGVSGSALAAFTYGYNANTDTEDINTKFADGKIEGYDYGVYTDKNGDITFNLSSVDIKSHVSGLYTANNQINVGNTEAVVKINLEGRLTSSENIYANCGKINILGSDISIYSKNDNGGVHSIRAKGKVTTNNGIATIDIGTINIGNEDTEKVTINTQGSGATNSIVNFGGSGNDKINVNAANIEVLTKNNASGNTIGVYNYADGSITIGSGITEQITINTVASGTANKAYGLYNNQKGNIEINSSKLNLKSSANGNSYGIYSSGKNETNIKNASVVSIEAESSSKNAY